MNVGETIGHYRILGELGRGGMGVVYKAEQIPLERFVALKALYPHLCSDPVTVMRFNREARTTALLNHPDRKSTRLNSSHIPLSRMPSSA